MEEDGAALGVGFAIDFHDSFGQLKTLDDLLGVTQANAVREFQKIEAASKGVLDLGGASAQLVAFGNASTRELATAARELARVEKAGEMMVRQLERQNATFGKTREELRMMKAETAAAAAESKGLTELAARIRATEAELAGQELAAARRARFAAEELAESRARAEAAAAQKAALDRAQAERAINLQLAERAQLEAAIGRNTGVGRTRATDAGASFSALAAQAAEQDAQAARSAAAAQKRLADEHERLAQMVRASRDAQLADAEAAERLRMATDPLYAATKRLNAEIAESTRLYQGGATAPAEYARQQQVLQNRLQQTVASHRDMDQSIRRGSNTLTQLSFQLNDVATMAASGAPAFQIFATQAGQIYQVAQMAEGGMKGFLAEVGGAAARFAPFVAVLAVAGGAFALFQRSMVDGTDPKKLTSNLGLTKAEIKQLKDVGIGTSDVLKATFQVLAEQAGISFTGMGKAWSGVLDWMTDVGRSAMANLYANTVGTMKAVWAAVVAVRDGKGLGGAWDAAAGAYTGAQAEANKYLKDTGAAIRARALKNEREQLAKQAREIIADRTPKKPEVDERAETLARELAATEALIKGLYGAADAYGVSTAAGIRARIEAEAIEKGIKKQADTVAYAEQQLRKYVAQQVLGSAEQVAAMRDQTRAQEFVNQAVRSGALDAGKASDALAQMAEQQKLTTSMSVAQLNRDAQGYEAARKALAALTDEQLRARAARIDSEDLQRRDQIGRTIEDVQLETRLTRELGAARVKALQGLSGAALDDELARVAAEHEKVAIQARAELESVRLLAGGYDDAAAAVLRKAEADKSQVDARAQIDDQTAAVQRYNDQLRETIGHVSGMGALGGAIGGLLGVFTGRTGDVRGVLGDVLNIGIAGTDKDGKRIASTIGLEVSRVFEATGSFGKSMAKLLGGAGTGMVAGSALFGSQSGTEQLGSAIGGAIGGKVGEKFLSKGLETVAKGLGDFAGPLGSIVGGIAGNLLGGLFTKAKWGRADLSSAGVSEASGNSGSSKKAAIAAGSGIFGSLENIAQQLGGMIADFGTISVGVRNGDYRVNTTGTSLKVKKGAQDFNDDAEAAALFAMQEAINRGAISGIRASTSTLLKTGDDLQQNLSKALQFEGVFADLKAKTDPIGFELENLAKQFDQLRATFKQAGASAEEYAQLEQLLALRREEVLQKERDAMDDVRVRIARAQGDDAAAIAIERRQELASAMSDAVRAELAQLYAIEDATSREQKLTAEMQKQADAAKELRDAWASLGEGIMDEVNRIRGLTDGSATGSFALLQGQFNAATAAARGGDRDAAGKLVGLSQSLLAVAGDTATSRQELDRVKAQVAASLEGTYSLIAAITGAARPASVVANLSAAATTQTASTPPPANDDPAAELRALREELAQVRADMNSGNAAIAGQAKRTADKLDDVSSDSGGRAFSVAGGR